MESKISIPSSVGFYILHYSPLISRKTYLESIQFVRQGAKWITEADVKEEDWAIFHNRKEVFGFSEAQIGSFFRTNTFHLRWPRILAHGISRAMLFASHVSSRFHRSLIGSKPPPIRLKESFLEFGLMHVASLREFINSSKSWYLVCEDDARFEKNFVERVDEISLMNKPLFLSLASGSGLSRQILDPRITKLGMMRIRPSSARGLACSMVSREYASDILCLFESEGIPDWLPIDLTFSLALHALQVKTYWSCPALVEQGSQSGAYKSNFR
jgi:hypothetical protein